MDINNLVSLAHRALVNSDNVRDSKADTVFLETAEFSL